MMPPMEANAAVISGDSPTEAAEWAYLWRQIEFNHLVAHWYAPKQITQ